MFSYSDRLKTRLYKVTPETQEMDITHDRLIVTLREGVLDGGFHTSGQISSLNYYCIKKSNVT